MNKFKCNDGEVKKFDKKDRICCFKLNKEKVLELVKKNNGHAKCIENHKNLDRLVLFNKSRA